MKTLAFRLVEIFYYVPCVLIGAALSVVLLPVVIGFIIAYDILNKILGDDIKDIEGKVKDIENKGEK